MGPLSETKWTNEHNGADEQVVPGISISSSGQGTVDSSLENVRCDRDIKSEGATELSVDLQHILSAIIRAGR